MIPEPVEMECANTYQSLAALGSLEHETTQNPKTKFYVVTPMTTLLQLADTRRYDMWSSLSMRFVLWVWAWGWGLV